MQTVVRKSRVTLRNAKELGIGKLTFLVFSLVIGAALYSAYHIFPFYYYFYEIQNQMESAIKVASTDTDEEIRQKLVYHIRKMELPVGDDQELRQILSIERDGGVMRIYLPYEEVFSISLGNKTYDLHVFKFKAYAEGGY